MPLFPIFGRMRPRVLTAFQALQDFEDCMTRPQAGRQMPKAPT